MADQNFDIGEEKTNRKKGVNRLESRKHLRKLNIIYVPSTMVIVHMKRAIEYTVKSQFEIFNCKGFEWVQPNIVLFKFTETVDSCVDPHYQLKSPKSMCP